MSHSDLSTEHVAILRYLNGQREHVLGAIDGLSDEELRRSVLPSGWTCLGLIQHLTLDVERFWIQVIVAGKQELLAELDALNDAGEIWNVPAGTSSVAVIDAYRAEVERSNAVIDATPMDAPPAWWPAGIFGDYRLDTVREIVLHVMTETATHAGHLDAVREIIDGQQWLVLTE